MNALERRLKRNPWTDYLTGGQLLLLLAILLLGILVRVVGIADAPRGFNQDEASAGYDAFAIAKYGIDRNGIHNPVHLIAWGSGQNAAYSWLCMPFIALLGLSVWSVRLPMALVGCVSLVIFYFLLKNIHRENKAFVLLGTFLFAIFPWHIMKSRWGLESNLFPDLVLWGTFLLSQYLKNEKPGWFYGALALFAFCAYAYGTAYCFLPFFVLPVGICLLLRKKVTWKQALLCALVLGVTVLPILLFVFINTFDYPQIELGFLTIPRLYVNRHTEMASVFSGNFLESSLKNFRDALKILVTQEDGLPWNAMPYFGLTYRVTLPLTLWGLVLCLKNIRKRNAQGPEFLMDLWFAASVVLMFVVKPNINRINIIMIPWMYYTIAGTADLAGRIPHGPKAAVALFTAAFLLFAKTYFTDYQSMIEHKFSYGLGDAITQAAQAEADRVYVTDKTDMPYIYTLFYTQADPNVYRATVRYRTSHMDFEEVASFDRYVFGLPETVDPEENAVYVLYQPELGKFLEDEFEITEWGDFALAVPRARGEK